MPPRSNSERIAERPGFIQFRKVFKERSMPTSLANWKGVPAPTVQRLEGRFIRLEKLDPARHGDDLFNALQGPGADPKLWDYLPYGPFPERSAFDAWLNNHAAHDDPYFQRDRPRNWPGQGILSLMSIVPEQGRIEIGHVTFGAPMQRSPKSTEAVYLLAKYAFEQGNRRLEWKCNNANARSKYAAERLGFSFGRGVPPAYGGQGQEPGYRVVFDHRFGMAEDWGGV